MVLLSIYFVAYWGGSHIINNNENIFVAMAFT